MDAPCNQVFTIGAAQGMHLNNTPMVVLLVEVIHKLLFESIICVHLYMALCQLKADF